MKTNLKKTTLIFLINLFALGASAQGFGLARDADAKPTKKNETT